MADKKNSGWSNLPPLYKKRVRQAVLAFLLVAALAGGWIFHKSAEATKEWESRIAIATAPVLSATDPVPAEEEPSETSSEETSSPEAEKAPDASSAETSGQPAATSEEVKAVAPPPVAKILVILTDAGISATATARAIAELPPEVALAFSPYAAHLEKSIAAATAAKHDTLLLLPLEPSNYPSDDPGPKALLTGNSVDANEKNLHWVLDKAGKVQGIMNHLGDKFLADENRMLPIIDAIRARGLVFVEDALTTPLAAGAARISGLQYFSGDVRIDGAVSVTDIQKRLVELEQLAQAKGVAIGIAHPYPVTIDALKNWAASLDGKVLKLVPLSSLISEETENEKTDEPDSAAPHETP